MAREADGEDSSLGLAVGRRGRRGDGGHGLRGYAEEEHRVMAAGVAVRCNLRSHGGEEEGGNGVREIVYPCIRDPDGEDEEGQAPSSLAVSTRWISAAKLLQSDLATLAQREGGE
ncbi:hypothetical protein BHE74_00058381 [Ensete ventricosum]|nr:hypothetical protein BHE74_00058381 [Ensete ventricosum]